MKEDRERWNRKYQGGHGSTEPSWLVKEFYALAPPGRALDIAAGQGRNAVFLARRGFMVEAVDILEEALVQFSSRDEAIHPICTDLDEYDIAPNRYSLIVNIRFLSRRLFPRILNGLVPGGVLIFEGLLSGDDNTGAGYRHSEYRLQPNELLHAFKGLRIVHYHEATREAQTGRPLASLVGIKS